jgi:hypothetical protein
MKRRLRRVVNFFAFNLLFFSLYLNFIHKDQVGSVPEQSAKATASVAGTLPVDQPEKYNKAANHEQAAADPAAGTAKLSIN